MAGLRSIFQPIALNKRKNLTIVMVTHDRAIAEEADRIVRLVDGQIAI